MRLNKVNKEPQTVSLKYKHLFTGIITIQGIDESILTRNFRKFWLQRRDDSIVLAALFAYIDFTGKGLITSSDFVRFCLTIEFSNVL